MILQKNGESISLDSLFNSTPPFVNLSHTFSGIGYILVDMNAIFESSVKKFNVDIAQLPLKLLTQHFFYMHDNLVESFGDIRYFYEYRNEYEDILKVYIYRLKRLSIQTEINLTDRIAAVITSLSRETMVTFGLRNDLYVCMLDTLIFNYPHVSSHVFHKDTVDRTFLQTISCLDYSMKKSVPNISSDSKIDIDESILHKFSEEFLDNSKEYFYGKSDFKYTEEEVCLFKQTNFFIDGFILHKLIQENSVKNFQPLSFELKNKIPFTSSPLELLMPPIPEKLSMKHLQNITKSAKSMYDGKFQYATIATVKAPENVKKGVKASKIKEENEKRLATEKKQKDDIWLNNFFKNFSKLKDLKSKRGMLESMNLNNDYINDKLCLLKIEVCADIWNIENKKESCEEAVLIPLYLECIKYFDKEDLSSTDPNEIDFVLSNLVDAGFHATAKELIIKHNIFKDENEFLQKYESFSPKPSDIDLYFQLKYAGDHLKRTLGSKKDSRVPFDPDGWQIELLDAVDRKESVVISAPTSSGKTFICFYVVETILLENLKNTTNRKSKPVKQTNLSQTPSFCYTVTEKSPTYKFAPNCSIVVFCLPTKALANQVSADVYARFKPQKLNLQGTLMNDKCNEPFHCQVLITIPCMLETLCSDINRINNDSTGKWIKYIIIDEVHKINDKNLGLKMERVIHQSKCPMLLLSATIGNIEDFYSWFKEIERKKGRECRLVIHRERFCELKTHVYVNNSKESFRKLRSHDFAEIDITGKITPLNCMFAYTHSHLKHFGFGNDLNFLPEELLNIYYYIYMVLRNDQKSLIKHLSPKKFFKSNIICKSDVKLYERHILNTFEKWVQMNVLDEEQVKEVYRMLTEEANEAFKKLNEIDCRNEVDKTIDDLFDLLNNLSNDNLLPVIIFNTDRDVVNKLAKGLYNKICKLDKIRQKDKGIERLKKEQKRIRDVKLSKDAWMDEADNVIVEEGDIKFTYLDNMTKLTDYEVEEEFRSIYDKSTSMTIHMAKRGIGIHHDAVNRRIKSATEILFRKKHIRVLFATETLALGINMPCRTVVFCGDSLQLDPMNYKQMSGRAGRRGYDTLGNVVFMNISKYRVQNLLVSMLPKVRGSYIYSNTSFVGFNIGESILSNPLLGISDINSDLESRIENLNISKNNEVHSFVQNYSLGEFFLKKLEYRKSLVEYQFSKYKNIHSDTFLWDLYVCNRDSDPGVFLLGLLIDNNLINYEGESFIRTISHLFEIVPLFIDERSKKILLPPAEPQIMEFLQNINSDYINEIINFIPVSLRNLQSKVSSPLFFLNSFLYFNDSPKNSYIYDFYNHGSVVKIKANNGINGGDLWYSLFKVGNLIKSVIRILEKQLEFKKGDSVLIEKNLKNAKATCEAFWEKFKEIFA